LLLPRFLAAIALALLGSTTRSAGASFASAPSGSNPAASELAARENDEGSASAKYADASTLPSSGVFHGREYLVPELAENPFEIADGPRPFVRRLSFSPGYGQLGTDRLFVLRVAFNPNAWLGYEVSLGHNPGDATHALLHTLSMLVRYPLPWRAQPYGSVGYGMFMVYPGEAISADPVTKNAITAGGGLEFYIRNDVALRVEARGVTVLGGEAGEETVGYQYAEMTAGLSFYRGLGN
jgi:hypothetical protein